MKLCSRTCNVLKKALHAGLKRKAVIETNLYDWEGEPQPHVIAQLTKELILEQPFAGRNTVLEVEKFLRHNKMKLKESHHDGQARGSEGAPNQGEGAGGAGHRRETDPIDETLAAEVSG